MIYFTLLPSFKTENEDKKAEEFSTNNSGWNRADRALEEGLARCQRTLNFMRSRVEESMINCKAPLCHSAIWPKRTKRISHPVRFISGDLIWQIVTSTNPPTHADSTIPGSRSNANGQRGSRVSDSSANNASRASINERRDPINVASRSPSVEAKVQRTSIHGVETV
jgi:hypothetical protein